MKKGLLFFFIFLNLICGKTHAQITADSILNRHKTYVLANEKVKNISTILQNFDFRSEQWPDINYHDQSMASWNTIIHLNRVYDLTLAWCSPSSKYYHNKSVLQAINAAVKHWQTNQYKCKNWWYNEIGVPQAVLNTIVLLKKDWNTEQLNNALTILNQYKINGTGANLSWSAGLGLYYGLLTNNDTLITKTTALLSKEIQISTNEGIQPDYSFHQHGKRLQISHYGETFILDNLLLAWELNGSKWAFQKEKVELLISTLLNGVQWTARGINTTPGTHDRSVSRKSVLKRTAYKVLIPYLLTLAPNKKDSITVFKNSLNGKYTLKGFHYFPYSDFAAYQQPGFSFFLKTISTRTLPTESINSENLKGKLLNSGDAYLIADGNEYFNLMPVWKWDHLPGTTSFEGAEKINQKPFNGALSNGQYGFSAMDYQMVGKDTLQKVSAKKMWASYQNVVVCLIADLKSSVPSTYTTLDQSRLQGKVTVNKVSNTLKPGLQNFNALKWIHHGNFAYIPLQKDSVQIFTGKVTGSWSSINTSQSDTLVTDQVFMPILKHSTNIPSTGYVLANIPTAIATEELANQPFWKVISNNLHCQAIVFKNKTIMASVYSPATIKYADWALQINKACLLMMDGNKVYVSDPTHQGGTVQLIFKSKTYSLTMPIDGTTSKSIELKL